MGQAIQLSIDEAKHNRDANAASKCTKQKALLLQKQKEEVARWQKDEKKSVPKNTPDIALGDHINYGTELDSGKMDTESTATVFNPLLSGGTSSTPDQRNPGTAGSGGQAVTLEMVELRSQAVIPAAAATTGEASRTLHSALQKSCSAVLSLERNISANYSRYITTYKAEDYLKSHRADAAQELSNNNQLSADTVVKEKLSRMLKRETTLKRLEISFKFLDLVAKIEQTERMELKEKVANQWVKEDFDWLQKVQAKVEEEKPEEITCGSETAKILFDIDECFKSLRSLQQLARVLMPIELNPPETSYSTHLIKDQKHANEDPHYVYDHNYGPSIQDAMV